MLLGIERINYYTPRFSMDALELAGARGQDVEATRRQVMVEERSVLPPFEDSVTMAVNAAKRMLGPDDAKDIELLVVGSESEVDFSKPIATWVHRYCGLPANCRSFDTKHACYSGTAAFKTAASWIAARLRPGKKALVINTDLSRTHGTRTGLDYLGGACAVAMLVSEVPEVLAFDPARAGYWTQEIYDTYRPTAREEMAEVQLSLYSYLDALDGSYDHFVQVSGEVDFVNRFKRQIYHSPFPGMTLEAHKALLNRAGIYGKKDIRESFDRKVAQGLCLGKRIGTVYGGSNFLSLMSLLHSATDLEPGDMISLFAYGSGCQGEFYEGQVGTGAPGNVKALQLDRHLDEREALALEDYERFETMRESLIECRDYVPQTDLVEGSYERLYEGRGLLVLKNVKNFLRAYGWS